MQANLNTYGSELRAAVDNLYSGLLRWIIFGFETGTDSLRVVETGNDTKTMFDEFNSSKVLYGYARIKDQQNNLDKYAFISWQGPAAPDREKLACTRNADIVKSFCRTVHVNINARHSADLDWDEIISKISRSPTVVSQQRTDANVTPEPVGSVYKPTDIRKDLPSCAVRRTYWKEHDHGVMSTLNRSQEKSPPGGEFSRSFDIDLESEEIQRRQRSAALRQERDKEIASIIEARKASLTNGLLSSSSKPGYKKVNPLAEIAMARKMSIPTSESDSHGVPKTEYKKVNPLAEIQMARKLSITPSESDSQGKPFKRIDAAAELMAARKMTSFDFESNSFIVGTNYQRPNVEAEIREARRSKVSVFSESQQSIGSCYEKTDPAAEIKAARLLKQSSTSSNTNLSKSGNVWARTETDLSTPNPPMYIYSPNNVIKPPGSSSAQPLNSVSGAHTFRETESSRLGNGNDEGYKQNSTPYQTSSSEKVGLNGFTSDNKKSNNCIREPEDLNEGLTAICLYDYIAAEGDELSFTADEKIIRIDQIDDGWWLGENLQGMRGLFPANYVRLS